MYRWSATTCNTLLLTGYGPTSHEQFLLENLFFVFFLVFWYLFILCSHRNAYHSRMFSSAFIISAYSSQIIQFCCFACSSITAWILWQALSKLPLPYYVLSWRQRLKDFWLSKQFCIMQVKFDTFLSSTVELNGVDLSILCGATNTLKCI